jgi:hypothetical protein
VKVTGAKDWKPTVIDAGAEWRISATCPTCGAALHWNLTPGTEEFQVWCHRDDAGADVKIGA